MEVFYSKKKLAGFLDSQKEIEKTIGLVPTMGALHEGHMSLIKEAREHSDIVVATIFVNPKQFDNKEDFDKYPVSIEDDIRMLETNECDAVFIPSEESLYGADDYRAFEMDLGYLDKILEGAKRPGHFNGVVEIVHLLFEIIHPDFVFFGMKDYQQVMVIEKMLNYIHSDILLFRCPIVRESDGLAISSRNRQLNRTERQLALNLHLTLLDIKDEYKKTNVQTLIDKHTERLNKLKNVVVDYIEIADSDTLQHLNEWKSAGKNLVLIAVFVGKVRLIDNLLF
ncbi:MAG: pantoate--beta-alanine ligase [Chitinophagales bacterium]|nr:pantoate--beta-alanine ligase [Chitinophagales bacterium]